MTVHPSRRLGAVLASVLVVGACHGDEPSQLGALAASHPAPAATAPGGAPDPWAKGADDGESQAPASGASSPFGDVPELLEKVAASVAKPGPYEAPDASADFANAKPHWSVMAWDGTIVEASSYSWRGGAGVPLRELTGRLDAMRRDASLTGLLVRFGGLEVSIPDAAELRAAMAAFRAAGKHLACFTEGAANGAYLVLAGCEQVALAPLGEILISGPSAMPIHIKGLLDKLGVTADFLHVGAYKGAAEPLTREAPSPEMLETLGAILDQHLATTIAMIAASRSLDEATVTTLIDTAMFPAPAALAAGLVDQVEPFEAFRDRVTAGAAWTEVGLEDDADKDDKLAAMLKLMRFVGAVPTVRPTGPHVALLYAIGDVVDGDGDGLIGARAQIASGTIVAAVRALAADDAVKAVVLRVDSGGGSAQASELIWRAVSELQQQKPVIVSMSDVAASGGYYIGTGATKIFAEPDTLTGSIGVVGGKIAPGGALEKLGVTTFPIGRGKRATMFTRLGPWTDEEKVTVQASMEAVYEVFVARVAAGRGLRPQDIQPIAQGRVWTGTKALELGLVDALGGLDAALAEARTQGQVPADAELEVFPPQPTLRDFMIRYGAVQAPMGLASLALPSMEEVAAGVLASLSPQVAGQVTHLLHLVWSFDAARIQAVALLPIFD